MATQIKVAFICQGVEYSQIVTLTPDCPDDGCTPEIDHAWWLSNITWSLCNIDYTFQAEVTPVSGATIQWTLGGNAIPAADGQWNYTFNGSVSHTSPTVSDGQHTEEICVTVTCPDGNSNTVCQNIVLEFAPPDDISVELMPYCGPGIWGGADAAVIFSPGVFALSEADYDAEVCYSDGTSMTLNLDMPMSFIKSFSGYSMTKTACLKIYEDGGLAAGDPPCLQVCDKASCLEITLVPADLAKKLLPEVLFNPQTCSIESPGLPESTTSKTRVLVFETMYPGGDDALEFLSAFNEGDRFHPLAKTPFGSQAGSYLLNAECNDFYESELIHPIVQVPANLTDTAAFEMAVSNAGPNVIVIESVDIQLGAGMTVNRQPRKPE